MLMPIEHDMDLAAHRLRQRVVDAQGLLGRLRDVHRGAFVVALTFGVLGTACGSGGSTKTSITTLRRGAQQYSLVQAQSALAPGTSRLAFGLVPARGAPRVGGTPQVWVAKDEKAR